MAMKRDRPDFWGWRERERERKVGGERESNEVRFLLRDLTKSFV